MPKHSRVLLIEDNDVHIKWVKLQLKQMAGTEFLIENTKTLEAGINKLEEGGVDIILLDMGLPDCDGLPTLNTLVDQFPEMPIVILSALEDELVCTEAVRQGAQDYFFKGQVYGEQLVRGLRYAMERKKIEAELSKERLMLRDLNQVMADQQRIVRQLKAEVDELRKEMGKPEKYNA